jgi:hypothetical protein
MEAVNKIATHLLFVDNDPEMMDHGKQRVAEQFARKAGLQGLGIEYPELVARARAHVRENLMG